VAIAESSIIIRSGLLAVFKRLPNQNVQAVELPSPSALRDCMDTQIIDILIVNPFFGDFFDITQFREEHNTRRTRLVALVSAYVDKNLLGKYDETISIYDDTKTIAGKIDLLQNYAPLPEEEETGSVLSIREKEIVVCVVKGMTNKEIADCLTISVHTVITHRKNITKKLQIHSASGLTIYSIVNKLVELSEIKTL
jgi:DNA-binding CsgD family transcriptional regulator